VKKICAHLSHISAPVWAFWTKFSAKIENRLTQTIFLWHGKMALSVVCFHLSHLQFEVSQDKDVRWIEKVKVAYFHGFAASTYPSLSESNANGHEDNLTFGCLPVHPFTFCHPSYPVLCKGWLWASLSMTTTKNVLFDGLIYGNDGRRLHAMILQL
jgi:hypothetical protein